MVASRRRAAVNYAEKKPDDADDLEEEHVEEQEHSEDEEEEEEEIAPVKTVPKQRKRRAEALPRLEGDSALLSAVRSQSAAISVAAKDWVDRYREDRAAAAAELLTFLLQGCGVTGRAVSADEVEHTGADEIKANADEHAREDGLEELLGGRSARHLKASYREMWDKVVREAGHAGILHDGFLLDKVVNLVIALNTSVVREFRRVATLTAAQLATSFLHVAVTLGEGRDTAVRQLAAEEGRKGKGGGAAERAAAFRRQVSEMSAAVAELLAYVDSIFQSVFTNRFRDIDPEVRLTVVDGLGRWMLLLPATFLSTSYLKYVAWALSDRDPGVRGTAAAALLAVYSHPANAAQLRDFTDRFAQRFSELMIDVDDGVAVAGVRLVTLLVRLGHLPVAAAGQVYRLMSDASPALRAAAAELVAGMLKERGSEALSAVGKRSHGGGRKGGRGKTTTSAAGAAERSDEELALAGVLHVMRLLAAEEAKFGASEGGDGGGAGGAMETDHGEGAPALSEKVVALVVGALLDRTPALRNWQLMVDWLRTDAAEDAFGAAGTADLCRCLLAALRRATGADASALPAGRAAGQKLKAAWTAARHDATVVLQKELPALVRRFQADADEVAAVVALIPELNLEVYSLRRQEKALSSLLASVRDVMFAHGDGEVAAACVAALSTCAANGADATRDRARMALAECVSKAGAELGEAVAAAEGQGQRALSAAGDAYVSSGGEAESAELFALRCAVVHSAALLTANAPGAADPDGALRDALTRLLELAAGGAALPAAVVSPAARSALLALVHAAAAGAAGAAGAAAPGSTAAIAAAAGLLGGQLEAIIAAAAESGDEEVRQGAGAVLCDLMAVFGQPLEGELDAAYQPTDAAVAALWVSVAWPPTPGVKVPPARLQNVARLAACAAVPQYRHLAAQVLSYWDSTDDQMESVSKELVKALKHFDSDHLPDVYLGAMKAAYQRCKEAEAGAAAAARKGKGKKSAAAAQGGSEEGEQGEGAAMAPFTALSSRIASSQAAFNAPEATLAFIVTEGGKWAVAGGADRADFLHGASFFATRLRGAAAEAALAQVEGAGVEAGVPSPDDDAEGPWDLFHEYCDVLRDRAAKPAASAMRKKGGRSKVGPGRKISFAPGAGSDSDGGGAPPKAATRAARKPAAAGKAASKEAVAAQPHSGGENEDDMGASPVESPAAEPPNPFMRRNRGQGGGAAAAAAATAGRVQAASLRADSESDEEAGQEESDEDGVMPTEEQLPGMAVRKPSAGQPAARAKGKAAARPRRQPLFAPEEEVAPAKDSEEESGEEEDGLVELPMAGGKGGRGGGSQQAVPADAEDDSDNESVQHARRRRRR